MIKALHCSVFTAIFAVMAFGVHAQLAPTETAVNEAIRRQADTILLRQQLIRAREAVAEQNLADAAKLYEEAYALVQRIGTGVDEEAAQATAGLASVRLDLARSAQKQKDYKEADIHLSSALRASPGDPEIERMKLLNDKLLAAQAGRIPSEETVGQIPGILKEKQEAGTLVQDGKLLYELGKLNEAEAKLKQALVVEPGFGPADYYLDLVRDAKYRRLARGRESYSRDAQVKVEQAWEAPVQRDKLPVPNPYARSAAVHTGKGRQSIVAKLDRIRMDTVFYDGLPLGEVIRLLNEESKKRDPDKKGINFLVNPNDEGQVSAAPLATTFDPITGLPIQAPPSLEDEATDIGGVLIKINPPLTDLRLADVLDAIVTVAEQPIRYSIEDYAIVFSLRGAEPTPLYTRTYKVDPNTFWQGLESVGGFSFGDIEVGSQGGSGGGRSGGRSSSRGGGGGDQGDTISIPRVNVGGAVSGNRGGQQSGNQSGVGLKFLTKTNTVEQVQTAVRQFFITMGVDLIPPKTVFFNDRSGVLWARATLEELDIIETAIQVLNVSPPQVNIKAKFADIGQRDQKAIGFDWFLGNFLMGSNGEVVGSGGTQPAMAGATPAALHQIGAFPVAGSTVASSADQLITSGLGNPLNAPALATFTGILTDPQFRVVIRALDQREGVDLLSAPEVTTVSGRQAQVQMIDIQSIVTGIDLNQTGSGGGNQNLNTGANGGGGVVASTLNYNVQALPFGPVLDVVPYVSADGYTVQMVIIPTVTEFIGYDDPGQFIPQAQSATSGQGGAGIPLTGQLPLPRFRLRQVTTSAVVWDGQTIVLGGLVAESVNKSKDKVPVLGDLPLFGRLFRSESSDTQKRNLIIFVTPTIIDPAGNRFHSEDEMPFAQNTIPEQRAIAPVSGQ